MNEVDEGVNMLEIRTAYICRYVEIQFARYIYDTQLSATQVIGTGILFTG